MLKGYKIPETETVKEENYLRGRSRNVPTFLSILPYGESKGKFSWTTLLVSIVRDHRH